MQRGARAGLRTTTGWRGEDVLVVLVVVEGVDVGVGQGGGRRLRYGTVRYSQYSAQRQEERRAINAARSLCSTVYCRQSRDEGTMELWRLATGDRRLETALTRARGLQEARGRMQRVRRAGGRLLPCLPRALSAERTCLALLAGPSGGKRNQALARAPSQWQQWKSIGFGYSSISAYARPTRPRVHSCLFVTGPSSPRAPPARSSPPCPTRSPSP